MIPSLPIPAGSADLYVDPPTEIARAEVEFSCSLVEPAAAPIRIWFRFPRADAAHLTRRADPFVLATLIYAMRRFERVRIHGTVSAGLLANLADFQAAFVAIRGFSPGRVVEFHADETAPLSTAHRAGPGITAFSGGVDSCFSLWRNTARASTAPQRPLEAALMMHGFDIPLEDQETFFRAAEKSRELTTDAGVQLHFGATNLRSLPIGWEDAFATAVAAALTFYEPRFAYGLIPSFQDWRHTSLTSGSNPLTDPLLSSLSFQVIHDGTGFGRIDKLRELTRWPAAMRCLRVCWQGAALDRNCCRCEKCLRTLLMLRVCGVSQPPAFPLAPDLAQLECLTIGNLSGLEEFAYLAAEAERLGIDEPWVRSARIALRRNRRRQRLGRIRRALGFPLPARLAAPSHSAPAIVAPDDSTAPAENFSVSSTAGSA